MNPGFTILVDEDLFSFCTVDYAEDYAEFSSRAAERIAFVKENPWVNDAERDDMLYMTAIPWVSFTSFMHPMHLQPADSIPRFAWGKFFEDGNSLKMPLAVQGHHALMDGVHVGKFYAKVQDYFHQPELVVGEAAVPTCIQAQPNALATALPSDEERMALEAQTLPKSRNGGCSG